ncbi:S-layer homology domain-containing protein [Halarsenatibacter silvermanii]|uniref:S-layer homology domain-containing protein n=1 Tax=Halarsenatibacter silvermanii TaxID=321763 RepID=A0A1G9HQ31_9FIRM|nr:S-layer homology domain-containing protein [Halarsenatibacter silvermanii]SDL15050.1 S-layer homology domain-containing protein [Halarsenatibacter silvermanii]
MKFKLSKILPIIAFILIFTLAFNAASTEILAEENEDDIEGENADLEETLELEDLEEDHWAYQAVTQLLELGIIEGYPEGEYRGEETIDRYEMAVIIDGLLATIEDSLQEVMEQMEAAEELSRAQLEEVVGLAEEVIAEEMEADLEGLADEEAEEVTYIVQGFIEEFEEDLAGLREDAEGIEAYLSEALEDFELETEEIEERIESLQERLDELEEEEKDYEGSLKFEIDTIINRIHPETVSDETDYGLTFAHRHDFYEGASIYTEWSPDTTEGFAEGDVLRIELDEDLHGLPGMRFTAMHDDYVSPEEHIFDIKRDAYLQTDFAIDDEVDLTLGADWDYIFSNELDTDDMIDESQLVNLTLGGTVDLFDFAFEVSDYETADGYEEIGENDLDMEGYSFQSIEAYFRYRQVIENLDFRFSYYDQDDEAEEITVNGGEIDDFDEDYSGIEVGASYDYGDRYSFHLDYGVIEAGLWPYSDGTLTDHPAELLQLGAEGIDEGLVNYESSFLSLQLDADDILDFDHYFLLERWDTDRELYDLDDDMEDYKFEWGMERMVTDSTELGLYTHYTSFDDDVLDDQGELADDFEGEEDSRVDFEVFVEHELYSW